MGPAVGRRRLAARIRPLIVAMGSLMLIASAGSGQEGGWSVSGEVSAGSELEEYLRLLQSTGQSAAYPVSLRALSAPDVERMAPRDSLHPWAGRFSFARPAGGRGGVHFALRPVRATMIHNSAFPYGSNDGAVWAGRGLTTVARVGFSARYGPVSLVVEPVVFRAANESFEIVTPPEGDQPLADWRRATQIDLPQRFGESAYTRVHPGESRLRVDLGPLAAEASTANQIWGTAVEYPVVLGTNAPGFPHVTVGTSRPANLWIGRLHGHFLWGRLSQSDYSPMPADSSARFTSGFVGTFSPRGLPGLELGATRFFHTPWSDGITWTQLARPLETLSKLKLSRPHTTGEIEASIVSNQLASVFFRWVLPRSGVELFGEYASEDHRHNTRDLMLEPDHAVAYDLGIRKLWRVSPTRFFALRAEALNGEPSHLARARRQEPFYVHARMRQGHTQEGQILGSPAAFGGSASTVALDLYHPAGRWGVAWRRNLQHAQATYLETGEREPADVQHALGLNALLFHGRWEITGRLDDVYEFNRNFGDDVFGTSASLSVGARF